MGISQLLELQGDHHDALNLLREHPWRAQKHPYLTERQSPGQHSLDDFLLEQPSTATMSKKHKLSTIASRKDHIRLLPKPSMSQMDRQDPMSGHSHMRVFGVDLNPFQPRLRLRLRHLALDIVAPRRSGPTILPRVLARGGTKIISSSLQCHQIYVSSIAILARSWKLLLVPN